MKQKGFTLIELLVVISIIGLLSSVVFASLNTARIKGRDAKRLLDKKQVVTALNLYYSANNAWPNTGGSYKCLSPNDLETCLNSTSYTGSSALASMLQPYI